MSKQASLTLYSYFYSSASWRVRAVLAMKDIPFTYQSVQLLKGGQHSEKYTKYNPMHQVPAVIIKAPDGSEHFITQSLAIIEYLEETYPKKPLLPKDPILRAKARAIAETISGGIQPLQNFETLVDHEKPLGREPLTHEERKIVASFWIVRKLRQLEELVKRTSGKYCVCDEVTIADVALVPQMFNARRFGVDTKTFPLLHEIDERLSQLDMFKVSHPMSCPDAPSDTK